MRLPVQICVHLFRKSPRRVETLILQRSPEHGGYWQGVTGAQEPGESIDEAAAREVREETGLEAVQILPTGFSFTFDIPSESREQYAKEDTRVIEHVFAGAAFAEDRVRISDEHLRFEWLEIDDAAAKLDAFPTQAQALRQAYDAYKHHGLTPVTYDPRANG